MQPPRLAHRWKEAEGDESVEIGLYRDRPRLKG